jgi:hypothetical protein
MADPKGLTSRVREGTEGSISEETYGVARREGHGAGTISGDEV